MKDQGVREQVVKMLESGMAHMGFEEAVKDFPLAKINSRAPKVEYTFWHLIEHLRLTQVDILEFITNPNYKEPSWPKDYWPKPSAKASSKDWENSVKQFNADLK